MDDDQIVEDFEDFLASHKISAKTHTLKIGDIIPDADDPGVAWWDLTFTSIKPPKESLKFTVQFGEDNE